MSNQDLSDISGQWHKLAPLYPNSQTLVFIRLLDGQIYFAKSVKVAQAEYEFHAYTTNGERLVFQDSCVSHFLSFTLKPVN